MIRVIVGLDSARTGKTTRLAELRIANDGTNPAYTRGNYNVRLMTKKGQVHRHSRVADHPRWALSVWKLVAKALKSVGHAADQA